LDKHAISQKEFGTLNTYIWQFVDGRPINHKIKSIKDIPINTKESDTMIKDLLKRGFKFVGSTICYAFMQAVDMVNDPEIYLRNKNIILLLFLTN
jgi:DNA-3-methyladenine glycosylase I